MQLDNLHKVPPQATDLEEAVLGAILLESHAILEVGDLLRPEVFYKEAHQKIYEAIVRLNSRGDDIDLLTVVNELKTTDDLDTVGGAYYVSKLTDNVATSANIETHVRIVLQQFMRRELIRISEELSTAAYDDASDIFDTLDKFQGALADVANSKGNSLSTIHESVKKLYDLIEANMSGEKPSGIPTGFNPYDKFSAGLHRGDLVVIGGETSNGKTSLALTIGNNAAKCGFGCGIWSYEMSDIQITARLVSQNTGVSSKEMLYTKLSDEKLDEINKRAAGLIDRKIFIDDCSTNNFGDLVGSIRAATYKNGIDIAVIDYLQLISNNIKGKQTEEQVADVANRLKALAKSLDICIILISQLARDRERPMPSRSRLKRSGDIEAAADVVILNWFPADYGIPHINLLSSGESIDSKGNAHVIVAKGRNIGMTDFVLGFDKELTMFHDKLTASSMNPESKELFKDDPF